MLVTPDPSNVVFCHRDRVAGHQDAGVVSDEVHSVDGDRGHVGVARPAVLHARGEARDGPVLHRHAESEDPDARRAPDRLDRVAREIDGHPGCLGGETVARAGQVVRRTKSAVILAPHGTGAGGGVTGPFGTVMHPAAANASAPTTATIAPRRGAKPPLNDIARPALWSCPSVKSIRAGSRPVHDLV